MAYKAGGVRLDTTVLDKITAELQPRAQKIVKETAYEVMGRAVNAAPVDTGALKNSIHVEETGALSAIVADGVEYGIYNELGTSRMAARPFLTPAVEAVRPRWGERWKELVR